MKKEYLDCKLALTAQCPNRRTPEMNKLLAKPIERGQNNLLTQDSMDAANALCQTCDAFVKK